MRLFGWSDLHVDHPANFAQVAGVSDQEHRDDVLLVAGDVSADAAQVLRTLELLRRKFREVAFVPGNHDLWVSRSGPLDSWEKLHELHACCLAAGIRVAPFTVELAWGPARVVPLRSWYVRPEEGAGSLFLEKPGEDPTLAMWADNYRIRWRSLSRDRPPAEHLLGLNPPPEPAAAGMTPDLPVVTFSHFLPRVELVFADWERFQATGKTSGHDRTPEFNFTRVAGCRQLDELLRRHGSRLHLYGHQHHNRDRVIAGVRYVSHCLGYPAEQAAQPGQPDRRQPRELRLNA